MPLETLSTELQNHLNALKSKLVEVGARQWPLHTTLLFPCSAHCAVGSHCLAACHPPTADRPPGPQVINDDYNDYVSLSTQLGGVDTAAARIQVGLLCMWLLECMC